MTTSQDLLDLAARCERAEGADRELDYAIFCATARRDVPAAWCPRSGHEYTASIDAAMTLVPDGEGHWPQLSFIGRNPNNPENDKFRTEIWIKGRRGALRSNANSLALAIAAAALRARAAIIQAASD